MVNLSDGQSLLSEKLSLIHKLGFYEESKPPDDIRRQSKLLDTIALLLCTGLPGEHFAVAFDKRVHLEIVLAKNGAITPEDTADAEELFSSLSDPEINTIGHLFPFISRRCIANLVKHVRKLRASIIDTGFYDDFCSRITRTLPPAKPISPRTEFPRGAQSIIKDYSNESHLMVLQGLLNSLVKATMISDTPDLSEILGVYNFALPLAHCRTLNFGPGLNRQIYERKQKFKRCAEKLCRYTCDVKVLIRDAKRLGEPIRYRWVTDESLGVRVGRDDIRIQAQTPLEAALCAPVLSSSERLAGLHPRYPSIIEPWQQAVHIRLHAELRIILHFRKVRGIIDFQRPIGVSRPSCLCCVLWMEEYNRRNFVRWVTRSRSKGDPTWALSACACLNVQGPDLQALDEVVVSGVDKQFQEEFQYASLTEYVDSDYDTVKLV